MRLVWEKPIMVFYEESLKNPERKAFAVIKARSIVISKVEGEGAKFRGSIKDFFPLWGALTTFLRRRV